MPENLRNSSYLIGCRAYLELFAPGGADNLAEGSSGIGFSTSQLGGGRAIRSKMESTPGKLTLNNLLRRVDGQDSIPWFESIRFTSLDQGAFTAWLMDFRPEYIKRKKIQLADEGDFDRHGYNASTYDTPEQKKAYEAKLFDDLAEVHLDLDLSEAASFHRFVTALGCHAAVRRERLFPAD